LFAAPFDLHFDQLYVVFYRSQTPYPRFSKSRKDVNDRSTSDQRYAAEWESSGDWYVSYVFSLIIKLLIFCPPVSRQSAQPPSPQDPRNRCETQRIFCYSNRRREDVADTIRAERGSTRGMERDRRHLVRNVAICLFLCRTESPTVSYNNSPELQYLFMEERPQRQTFLLEGRRSFVNPVAVSLMHGNFTHTFF
jgi:hypothetical protein